MTTVKEVLTKHGCEKCGNENPHSKILYTEMIVDENTKKRKTSFYISCQLCGYAQGVTIKRERTVEEYLLVPMKCGG